MMHVFLSYYFPVNHEWQNEADIVPTVPPSAVGFVDVRNAT
jgi:hypothetical protein